VCPPNTRPAKAAQARPGRPDPTSNVAGNKLLAAMLSNLQRAKEPALIEKLAAAIERVQAARRRCP
jgi:DNA-binding MurR/RpiR family transcriptional regulator